MSQALPANITRPLALIQKYQSGVGLLLVWIVALAIAPKSSAKENLFGSVFFSLRNLDNGLSQLAVPGMLAIGATFVIVSGGIDLSAGSALGLLNCICATWLAHGTSPTLTCLYVLAVGSGIGCVLGLVISLSKLQPFVVTLAAMVTLRGIAFVYTNNGNVSGLGAGLDWMVQPFAGIPVQGWILLFLAVVAGVILKATVFGRRVYAIGGNLQAARYAGVPILRSRMATYGVNGFCVAVAAILFTSRNGNGQPSAGGGYELDAITAAVVGGASLSGGIGNILGTVVGALFIVSLNILLILQGVSYYVGQGWKGIIILVAVFLQNLGRTSS
jgi:ribose transport system permease protein